MKFISAGCGISYDNLKYIRVFNVPHFYFINLTHNIFSEMILRVIQPLQIAEVLSSFCETTDRQQLVCWGQVQGTCFTCHTMWRRHIITNFGTTYDCRAGRDGALTLFVSTVSCDCANNYSIVSGSLLRDKSQTFTYTWHASSVVRRGTLNYWSPYVCYKMRLVQKYKPSYK